MRDNYFEENRRMLVRQQADATRGLISTRRRVCLAVAERPRNVSGIWRAASLAWPWHGGGSARPDAPDEAGARGRLGLEMAPTGAKIFT
jgi:hypothetical protein